jgi:flagellar biosynthetic protein FliO
MDWLWLKTLASLLLILGLIVATLWVMKRFIPFGKLGPGGSSVAMDIAGVLHLAPKRSVYAVKTGGQVILLGVAEHGITYLTQFPEASCASAVPAALAGTQQAMINTTASPFFSMLVERFKTGAVAAPEPAVSEPAVSEPAALDEPAAAPLDVKPVVKKTRISAAAPRKKAPKQL